MNFLGIGRSRARRARLLSQAISRGSASRYSAFNASVSTVLFAYASRLYDDTLTLLRMSCRSRRASNWAPSQAADHLTKDHHQPKAYTET